MHAWRQTIAVFEKILKRFFGKYLHFNEKYHSNIHAMRVFASFSYWRNR